MKKAYVTMCEKCHRLTAFISSKDVIHWVERYADHSCHCGCGSNLVPIINEI